MAKPSQPSAMKGAGNPHEFGNVTSHGTNHGFEHIHIKHAQSNLNTAWEPGEKNENAAGGVGE